MPRAQVRLSRESLKKIRKEAINLNEKYTDLLYEKIIRFSEQDKNIIEKEINKLIDIYSIKKKSKVIRIETKSYNELNRIKNIFGITSRQLIDIIVNPLPKVNNEEEEDIKVYRHGKAVLELRISLFENQKFKGKKVVKF